jgi:Family of unknown function (DUF5317)
MILALAVALGLAISWVRYGNRTFRRIAALPLRSVWLALLALALQWPLLRAPKGPVQSVGIQQALFLLSHLFLLAFVWRNRQMIGVQFVGLGVICNLLVILANGGLMPITTETLLQINPGSTLEQWSVGTHYGYSKDIILLRDQVKLWALSDILVVPPGFLFPAAFSVGDLLIAAGIIVLLQGSRNPIESATTESSLP